MIILFPGVTTGNIIAIGIRSTIVKPDRDLTSVYSKIEEIMFGSDGRHTDLRNVQDGSAYVMVVKKGNRNINDSACVISTKSHLFHLCSNTFCDMGLKC